MHICIIAYKRLVSESRVLRQVRTFRKLGWKVTLAGFIHPGDSLDEVSVIPLQQVEPRRTWTIPQALARSVLSAKLAWGLHPQNKAARAVLHDVQTRFDYVIAHDWPCAPLAQELAERQGISFGIDVHEYARLQFCPTGKWLRDTVNRYVHGRHADALQRYYLPKAKGITTVCDGIADLLQRDYALTERPRVVRSVPFYTKCSFNPCTEKIKILYHGMVDYSRRLEVLIRAIPLLDDKFIVEIRGPKNKIYLDGLKKIVSELGVENRVEFSPQVPFSEIISEANKADIGYEVVDGFSPQHQFMLPNKFFENTMAGLALCVSNFREMARVIEKYHHGICVEICSPEVVATTLNSLSCEQINDMKKASLVAAKDLCWEKEERNMLDAYHLI